MSEYWKSTPKYWCKHCSTYVKDTPFERKQHENTGKHQGNLKRFLRGIQNDHEKNERDKEKAKAEVDRLNKVVGASTPSTTPSTTSLGPSRKTNATNLTAVDQKRQWAQLAEMGIQVPENFRAEMAMPGQWQSVSQSQQEPAVAEDVLGRGVRKRKLDGEEEDDDAREPDRRRGWGTTTRRYPGEADPDLDALLSGPIMKSQTKIKTESGIGQVNSAALHTESPSVSGQEAKGVKISEAESEGKPKSEHIDDHAHVKHEDAEFDGTAALPDEPQNLPVPVFKRRKVKSKAEKETG